MVVDERSSGGKRAHRHVPLHELQQKYGALYGTPAEPANRTELPDAKRQLALREAGVGKRSRNKGDHHSIVQAKVTDIVRGFEPFDLYELADPPQHDKINFSQFKRETAMHEQFLASLSELDCLATELDLTFQSLKSLPSVNPTEPSSRGSSFVSRAVEGDEFVLDVELQKFGGSHSIVLRSPATWKLHHGISNKPQPVWGAKSRSTADSWITTLPNKVTNPVAHVIGDNEHTLCLELAERIPESISVIRCGRKSSSKARCFSARRVIPGSARDSLAVFPGPPNAATALAVLDTSAESFPVQCRALERNFIEKISRHHEMLLEDLAAKFHTPVQRTGTRGLGSFISKEQQEEEAAASIARVRAKAKDYAQDYLSDIRSALRLLAPTLPSAVRVIEGAVKALVVALDSSLSAAWRQAESSQTNAAKLEEDRRELDELKCRVCELERDNHDLHEQLSAAEQRYQSEASGLREKLDFMKKELERLSPDQSEVDGVAGLMGEYNVLMQDMLEENAKQTQILEQMTSYTVAVVGDATANPADRKSKEHGRVVELLNGELLLRPHAVADGSTQIVDTDLLEVNPELPVRLRTASVRQIMNTFDNKETPIITVPELLGEIDKIYNTKIQADQDADAAGLPRSELIDYVVEFYLHSTQCAYEAQSQACAILRCLQSVDRGTEPIPTKVSLFARFLSFCEYQKSLPLTVLNVVLQAKRRVVASMSRQTPSDKDKNKRIEHAPRLTVKNAKEIFPDSKELGGAKDGKEATFGVAVAYEAAMKALPNRIPALRELFVGVSKRAEVESDPTKRAVERDMLVLALLLLDRLQREGARELRDVIQRAEQRGSVTTEEFREAVRDAGVLAIDDAVWKPRLADPQCPGNLSTDLLLDYLGGGSPSRLPRATISESCFMLAVTDAFMADYDDRLKHVQGLWQSFVRQQASQGTLNFADFGSVMHSEDPLLPAPAIRALYLTSIEMSRSCTQINGDPCISTGTLEEVRHEYGGDLVTFKLFSLAALKCGLFLKDFGGTSNSAQNLQDSSRGAVGVSAVGSARLAVGITSRQPPTPRRGNRPR